METENRRFKLIVKSEGETSVKMLRFIRKNINQINMMGIYINIVKLKPEDITPKLVRSLKNKNARNFPVLILDNGKIKDGIDTITDLFKQNMARFNNQINGEAESNVPTVNLSEGNMVDDYMRNELNFDALKNDEGEESENGGDQDVMSEKDIHRRISMLQNKRSGVGMESPDQDNFDADISDRNSRRSQYNTEMDSGVSAPARDISKGNIADDMFEARYMEGVEDDYF